MTTRMRCRPNLKARVLSALLLLSLCAAGPVPAVEIVSSGSVFSDVASARSGEVTSFMLSPDGDMVHALGSACDRGSTIAIQLDRAPFSYAVAANQQSIMQLLSHHCRVSYASGDTHLKVALLPRAMYLTDRNFTPDGLFVRDTDAHDRAAVLETLRGRTGATEHFWTRKSQALQAEAAFIATANRTLFVETESFGSGNPVYDAIRDRLSARVAVYLLVSSVEYGQDQRERQLVAALASAGAQIRLSSANAKLSVSDANGAWVGSANATSGVPEQTDWGLLLGGELAAQAIAKRFSDDWGRSAPLY